MGTKPTTPLAVALFAATRRKVLAMLLGHPDERFYTRELARMTGVAVGALQRELTRLTSAGILMRSVRGNQVYYQANAQCPVFDELAGICAKTFGLADLLRAALSPLSAEISIAFVYGSAAGGVLRQSSDVDLLVVGEITFARLVAALAPVQERLAREVNPTVYPAAEFGRRVRERQHFLTSVLGGPKIFLIGDERELAGLAEERLAQRTPVESAGDRGSSGGG